MTRFMTYAGSVVAADPKLISAQTWIDLKTQLEGSQMILLSLSTNLIDEIWTEEDGRPEFKVVTDCKFFKV